jgi:hypothetical protein
MQKNAAMELLSNLQLFIDYDAPALSSAVERNVNLPSRFLAPVP